VEVRVDAPPRRAGREARGLELLVGVAQASQMRELLARADRREADAERAQRLLAQAAL
jgi:hypothetical protein